MQKQWCQFLRINHEAISEFTEAEFLPKRSITGSVLSFVKKIQELAGKSHGIKLFIMRPFKCAYILSGIPGLKKSGIFGERVCCISETWLLTFLVT